MVNRLKNQRCRNCFHPASSHDDKGLCHHFEIMRKQQENPANSRQPAGWMPPSYTTNTSTSSTLPSDQHKRSESGSLGTPPSKPLPQHQPRPSQTVNHRDMVAQGATAHFYILLCF